MKGKLIVLEGTDSSGKGTQARILVQKLKQEGRPVETIDFPQYYNNFYGKLIGKFLKGDFGDPTVIDPYSSSILYAGDRLESKNKLVKWMEQGKIVILNRYVPSNLGFNLAKIPEEKEKTKFVTWLEGFEYEVNGLPKPDLVLFLDVPLDVAQQWIKNKEKREYIDGAEKDKHEENIEYLQRVYDSYINLCSIKESWVKIDCSKKGIPLSIEEISNKIFEKVDSII